MASYLMVVSGSGLLDNEGILMSSVPQIPMPQTTPPHQLEGVILPNGWIVGAMLVKQDGDTGGNFSVGYECTSSKGENAFLKAIDLYKPLQNRGGDVIKALQPFIQAVQGERGLLEQCRRMDRVVSAIDGGDLYELNGQQLPIPVPYIIFERAFGNARSVVYATERPAHGWCLRTLHQVAVGLWQMHSSMIAHQDVKLSNILLFAKDRGAKISDLGRSVQQGRSVPHDQIDWPGDRSYSPPEFAYGYTPAEFNVRRLAADLYLLGSCACSIFTGVSTNGLLYAELHSDFYPRWQQGTYTGSFVDVLPHLRDAFERVLDQVRTSISLNAPYREGVVTMIREWCDPDPSERGHPRTRAINAAQGNIYSLERYLATLDILAYKAMIFDRTSSRK